MIRASMRVRVGLLTFGVLLATISYGRVVPGDYVYEDHRTMTFAENETLENALASLWPPTAQTARRLTMLTHHWQLNQPAWAQRLVNIGLHAVVAILVFFFMRKFVIIEVAAWAGTLAFAVNALTMESVVYVVGRSELLAAIGVLAACLLALSRHWPLAILALGIGVLGKQSAIVGLAIVPLVLGRTRLALLMTMALLVVATPYQYYLSAQPLPWYEWALTQGTATYRLMLMSIVPIGQTVDFDYATISLVMKLVACLSIVGFGCFAWRIRKTVPHVFFGFCWAMIAVSPRFIVQTTYSELNEHQWYLSLIGFGIAVAGVVDYAERRSLCETV